MKRGISVKLVDRWCEVFMIDRKTVIVGEKGQTVSLLPVTESVTGVTLSGFEYPLKNGVMETGHPYGISNRLREGRGIIEIGSGLLLVIRYFEPDLVVDGGER
jgi:thiamine pyrophosphokinase